jgi:hypothetical protein
MRMKPIAALAPVIAMAAFTIIIAPTQPVTAQAKQGAAKKPAAALNCQPANSHQNILKNKNGQQVVVIICSHNPVTAHNGVKTDSQHSGGALRSRTPFGFTLQ